MEILIMFLTPSELTNNLYGHVIDNITQNDPQVSEQGISAAIGEMKSYLAAYDADTIFSATGSARNPLILENTKVIAIWNILKLSSAETLYDTWRERYDRVVDFMTKVAEGKITPDLPVRTGSDGEISIRMRMGSNPKFTHDV
jgi:phage gp36-like protein